MKCTNGSVTFNTDFGEYRRTPLQGDGKRLQEEAFYWIAHQEIQDTRAWNVKAFSEAKFFKQNMKCYTSKSTNLATIGKNS